MLVEIWSDIVCPWCYIGKRRFEAAVSRFEHAEEVEVRWRSFELDPNAPLRRKGTMAEHLAAKYGMTIEAAHERLEGMNRLAAADGLEYDLARTKGGNTFDAHRVIHLGYSKSAEVGAALKEALLEAYFTELEPISEPGVLLEIAAKAGLDRDEVADLLASDRFAQQVRHEEAEAADLGCTGVPFFVFDRVLAVPGAQDSETFLATLRRVWDRGQKVVTVSDAAVADPTEEEVGTGVCDDDACAV